MFLLSYGLSFAWTKRPALAGFALAIVLSALVMATRWHQDWGDSEGTYALTARSLLNGGDLYGDVVVAQPPVLFVVGAGVLAIGDSLEVLRAVMVALQLLALALLAAAVWRMTRSQCAVALTPPLGVLLPWTVHQQGSFQPEALALPCLAGALVLAARRRGSGWAGAFLAIAVGTKLPMAIPALFGVWAATDRRAAVAGFAATLMVLGAVSLAVFGDGVVNYTVLAQLEVGRHAVRPMAGVGVQAAWNLTPLALGCLAAALAWRRGWRPCDPQQWRVAVALGAGTMLTLASITKVGTSLSVMPPVEALLLPVAMTGAAAWLKGATFRRALAAVGLGGVPARPIGLAAGRPAQWWRGVPATVLAARVGSRTHPARGRRAGLRPSALPKHIAFQPRPRRHLPRPPPHAWRTARPLPAGSCEAARRRGEAGCGRLAALSLGFRRGRRVPRRRLNGAGRQRERRLRRHESPPGRRGC